jgi:hypothetical protein
MKISGFQIFILVMLIGIVSGSIVLIERKKEKDIAAKKLITIQLQKDEDIRKKAIELNANYSWTQKLESASNASINLLSYQVEKAWLIQQPILFVGEIQDIKQDGNGYKLQISKSMHDPVLMTNLEIRINCNKPITEKFLDYMNLNKKKFDFEKPIAVIAKINSVTSEKNMLNGTSEEIKIGIGECLELMPSTDNLSFHL